MSTSVYQRADGYWVAAVKIAGKKIVKYGRTEREAQAKLRDLIAADATGTLAAPTRLTFGQWAAQWLASVETERRPSTLRSYHQTLTPLLVHVGHVRLDRLTPLSLTMALSALRKGGMGPRRVELAYIVAGTCLRRAVRLGLLASSPMERVDRPRAGRVERHYWDGAQTRRFLDAAASSPHRYAPLFALLACSGLRIGEALGLEWRDVNRQRGMVHVRRAWVYAGSQGQMQRPKTLAGERVVTLPTLALAALDRLPRTIDPAAPVFVTGNGTRPTHSDLRMALHRLCDRAGVPTINLHGLRHVHAALLAAYGADPHTLAKRLGHAQVSTTMDLYAYAFQPDAIAVQVFDKAIQAG